MKKNLKIVSATAAALLAVAPVAASTISTVNADTDTTSTSTTDANTIDFGLTGSQLLPKEGEVTVTPNIKATAAVKLDNGTVIPGSISGNITASFNGQNYTSNFKLDDKAELRHEVKGGTAVEVNKVTDTKELQAGNKYTLFVPQTWFNFGSANANKEITLGVSNANVTYKVYNYATDAKTGKAKGWQTVSYGNPAKITTNQNGVVMVKDLEVDDIVPSNPQNAAGVSFYNSVTGNAVNSGSVSVNADADGNVNVAAILAAISNAYRAGQVGNHIADQHFTYSDANDIAKDLKSQGFDVNSNGSFKATKSSFTVNYKATSDDNKVSATLPVTVNVPNVTADSSATEPSQSTQIMYKSVVYNSKGEKTNDTIAGYDYANLVTENGSLKKYTINGGTYYKIADKDGYVRARNVTGSKMTLKKNAYAYKSNGKRANKTTYKKGRTITVYGGEYKAIKGYKGKAVRIGVNKYIKSANVNYKLAD